MQPSKSYNFGRTREAGSLETTTPYARKINVKSSLTEVERSSQYDDLFIQPVELEPETRRAPKSAKKKENKNFLRYDLDRIEIEKDSGESLGEEEVETERPTRGEKKDRKEVEKPKPKRPVNDEEQNALDNSHLFTKQDNKFSRTSNPFLANSLSLESRKQETNKTQTESLMDNDSDAEANDNDQSKDAQIRPTSGGPNECQRNDFNHPYFDRIDHLGFLFLPAPGDFLVRCTILVHVNKLTTNDYELYIDDSPRDVPLLFTRSKRSMTSVNLTLYSNVLEPDVRKYRQKKLGKLKSDMSRNSYHLSEVLEGQLTSQRFKLLYRKFSIATRMPKEFEVLLKSTAFENISADETYKLATKIPEYDKVDKTFKLDFKGRAKKASSNNMQLVDTINADRVLWQLGKVKKNQYILDFSYPFTIFSAFGAALACLSRR